jgi:carboxymethylenebutenolidase
MKTLFTTLLSAMLFITATTTQAQNCCKKPAGNSMQALALNASFKASHEAPLPFSYTAEKGAMMKVPTKGGADANVFFIPADEQTDNVLIVVHEWWGLNDYIKKEAEEWQKRLGGKVAVYAIDLYDGQVAADPETAGKLMSSLTPERGDAIIKGVLQKIGKGKKIATIGWCMGGSWSFRASALAGNEAAGCIMYYGFPEKDAAKVKAEKADVLYIYGSQDGFIKRTDVDQLEKQVKANGHTFELHTYDAVHAFANPSNPKYNKVAAAEAQTYALKFLQTKLSIQ